MKPAPVVLLALAALLGAAPAASAQTTEEPAFLPVLPEAMGRGGASLAGVDGYEALFTNPAAFARSTRSLTVSSASAWAYGNPVRFLDAMSGGGDDVADFLGSEITRGGVGYGAAAGIGYVGGGLGLGLAMVMDSYLYGSPALSAEGDLSFTVGFVAGLAIPVQVFGIRVDLGADVRPMVRVRAPFNYRVAFDLMDVLSGGGDPLAAIRNENAWHGFGFGVDLGAVADLGRVQLGLSVRDLLGTRFSYSVNTVDQITTSLRESFNLPEGPAAAGEFVIPMNVGLGVAWHPDLGAAKTVIDPVFHADVQDVVGVLRDGRSPWTLLHLGVEARLLSFLEARAGLNQGYLTFGAGVKLLFLELDAAVFTREMGVHLGDRPSTGLTLEGAVRF